MSSRWPLFVVFTVWVPLFLPASVLAQRIPFAVGGDNVESESSMIPFKVKLRGILNATAKEKSLGTVILGINEYREKYDFAVVTAEAVDNPRISGSTIIRQYKDGKIELKLAGPKELLSKIGQAEPGTPLSLVGFLRQREKTLQLTNIETLGIHK